MVVAPSGEYQSSSYLSLLLPHEDNVLNKFRILKERHVQMRNRHLCSIRTHLVLRISKIENSQNVANNYSNQCVAGGGGILTGNALIRGLNTSKCDLSCRETLTSHLVRMKNSSYYIALVGD